MITLLIAVDLAAEKVSTFLDYLEVELGNKMAELRSSAQFLADGNYVNTIQGMIRRPGDGDVPIRLTVTQRMDGTLAPIEAYVGDGASPGPIEAELSGIVLRSMVATVNGRRTQFFRRDQFAYTGPVLDGEYYMARFRIAPAIPDDTFPLLSERVVYVDHYVEAVDQLQSMALGMVQANRTAALLSLFLDTGFYRISGESRWVYVEGGRTELRQLGFSDGKPYPVQMPPKGEECRAGRMQGVDRTSLRDDLTESWRLHCPSEIRDLFRCVDYLSHRERTAFQAGAALYQIALTAGHHYPTIRLSYQVAAVDALIVGKRHTTEAFIELVQAYCPEAPVELIKGMYYNIRSGHFHTGTFPGGEFDPHFLGLLGGRDSLARMGINHEVSRITRTVILRWLLKNGNAPAQP